MKDSGKVAWVVVFIILTAVVALWAADQASGAWRSSTASWYGPGFYGNTTACGQHYTTTHWGTAHKSLPCGTLLDINYNGRTAYKVPVTDRGPFIAGREFDLSGAVKLHLNFHGAQRIRVRAHKPRRWCRAVRTRTNRRLVRCARSWDGWTKKRGKTWVRTKKR